MNVANFLLDLKRIEDLLIWPLAKVLPCMTKHDIERSTKSTPGLGRPHSKRVLEFAAMKKDLRFTFRIQSDLKKELEAIAAREGRSVAQICDAFLKAGTEAYKKKGSKYLQSYFSRQQKDEPQK